MNKNSGATLYLPVEKKWFDMHASGEKLEEYRKISPYYISRFFQNGVSQSYLIDHGLQLQSLEQQDHTAPPIILTETKDFDFVCLINGYGHHRPHLIKVLESISVGIGKKEWGAPEQPVFILKLGNEVDRKNFKKSVFL